MWRSSQNIIMHFLQVRKFFLKKVLESAGKHFCSQLWEQQHPWKKVVELLNVHLGNRIGENRMLFFYILPCFISKLKTSPHKINQHQEEWQSKTVCKHFKIIWDKNLFFILNLVLFQKVLTAAYIWQKLCMISIFYLHIISNFGTK